jgi:hypothetical protein
VAFAAVLVSLSGPARADVIVTTYGDQGTGYQPADGYLGAYLSSGIQAVANSFSTGAYTTITALTAEVYGSSPVGFSVFADQSGMPAGAALWTSTTTQIPAGEQDGAVTFSGLSIAVQPGGTYWLMLSVPAGYTAMDLWDYSDNSPPMVTTIALTSDGWNLVAGQPVNAFTVEGTDVPEPWSGSLLVSGVAGALLLRPRRRGVRSPSP